MPRPPPRVPAAVQDAIKNYVPPEGFISLAPSRLASSFIYKHGVMIQSVSDGKVSWQCLTSQQCRGGFKTFRMCQCKTSKAVLHLREKHGVVSPKTASSHEKLARREARLLKLQQSRLYKDNPARFSVLLETLRIVLNNLPYRSVEYEESWLLRELCCQEAFRTAMNAKLVNRTIHELYVSAKQEIRAVIDAARMPCASFTVVTDFWTSKVQATKYVGVRVYFVDAAFKFKSILLGTRPFNPLFGERDLGVKGPYRRWLNGILADFGLTQADLYGSTTDGGGDVKRMMKEDFALEWAWCVSHMCNAATKNACGLVDDVKKSNNPAMTKLLKAIVKTVYQTKHVEVMGSLFEELCNMLSTDKSTQLLDYRSHRFLGLTRVIERILAKWNVLEQWYAERRVKAIRERSKKIPVFLLQGHKTDLTQLLSILIPISYVTTIAQAEDADQVDVLLALYTLRLSTINPDEPLRDHRSQAPPAPTQYFQVDELTPLVTETRKLLCEAFFKSFFKRYTNSKAMAKCSFAFEMQLAMHPDYKILEVSLLPLVKLLHRQHRASRQSEEEQKDDSDDDVESEDDSAKFCFLSVAAIIKNKISNVMLKSAPRVEDSAAPATVQSENRRLFGSNWASQHQDSDDLREQDVRAEIMRWFSRRTCLNTNEDGELEAVTSYWQRQLTTNKYNLLPLASRAIFSIPTASAQLERDFGVSGMHVTAMRARVKGENVDMTAFLNRNRDYVDITQCTPLQDSVVEDMQRTVLEEVDGNFEGQPVYSNDAGYCANPRALSSARRLISSCAEFLAAFTSAVLVAGERFVRRDDRAPACVVWFGGRLAAILARLVTGGDGCWPGDCRVNSLAAKRARRFRSLLEGDCTWPVPKSSIARSA